jgi:hypothetical protein
MKVYLAISCVVFGLIVVAHLARIVLESHELATDPSFVVMTVAAAALSVWSGILFWRFRRAA